jgi:large subunit ribosomal protein L31e
MAEEELERVYVIPLRNVKRVKTSNQAPKAIKTIRNYLIRHMKVEEKNVWIDDSLNREIWSKGRYNIPNKIRVRAVKFEDGIVEASLPELGFKKSRRELLKEEREKKEPILRREEVPEAEGEIPGAEDYEIAPTGEGEVKIKKKKAPKKKEEEPEEAKKKSKRKKTKKKEEKPEKKPKAKKAAPAKKKKTITSKKTGKSKTTTKKKAAPKKKAEKKG